MKVRPYKCLATRIPYEKCCRFPNAKDVVTFLAIFCHCFVATLIAETTTIMSTCAIDCRSIHQIFQTNDGVSEAFSKTADKGEPLTHEIHRGLKKLGALKWDELHRIRQLYGR